MTVSKEVTQTASPWARAESSHHEILLLQTLSLLLFASPADLSFTFNFAVKQLLPASSSASILISPLQADYLSGMSV